MITTYTPFPEVRVGDPVCHEALSVFPLYCDSQAPIDYRLAHEAIEDGSVRVEELDESGSVPELKVQNLGDVRVLFVEGEELVGAKQNRVVNATILVGAHTEVTIPVSCVEEGRWEYRSRGFRSSGSHSPAKLRFAMKRSVSASMKRGDGYMSNQRAIWGTVSDCLKEHGVSSPTNSMRDAFEARENATAAYREKLAYVAGASGIAVAIGDRVVSCDVFDKPGTCEKTWERLLSGSILEAMATKSATNRAGVAEVERLLATISELDWEPFCPIGEGVDFRASATEDHASALVFADSTVHGSVVSQS
jgi:hypothetical protein